MQVSLGVHDLPTRRSRRPGKRPASHTEVRTGSPTNASYRQLFVNHKGKVSDKWEHYLSIYDLELRPMMSRHKPMQLLEIGVQNGGSLEVWGKFLPAGSTITGIDVDPRCSRLRFDGSIEVLIGDAADPQVLDRLLASRRFDIIIDDGSHRQTDILSTFRSLFPRLKHGGKYLLEDLHASYWRSHGGGYREAQSAIEFFKTIIDAQNLEHFEEASRPEGRLLAELQAFNSSVGRVSFYDSVAVVEKYAYGKTAPFRRLITGRRMRVTQMLSYVDAMTDAPASIEMIGPVRNEALKACVDELDRVRSELVALKSDAGRLALDEGSSEAGEPAATPEMEALRAKILSLSEARAAASGEAAALQAALADRDLQIEQYQAVLRDKAAEIEVMAAQIASREADVLAAEIARRERELAGQTQQILELRAAADSRAAEVGRLGEGLAERDLQIVQLQTAFQGKCLEVEVLSTKMAGAEASLLELQARSNLFAGEAARLEAAVAERVQECSQLQEVIDQKMTELEAQAVALRDRDSKIVDFRAAAASMEAQSVRREEALAARDAKIAALESLSGFAVEAETLRMTLSNAQAENAALQRRMTELEGDLLAYETTIAANEARILELADSVQSHSQMVAVLGEQGARARDREAEQVRTIEALNARLDRIHAAWVFKLDSVLVRSVKMSAFGLARPAPLLLTSRPSS